MGRVRIIVTSTVLLCVAGAATLFTIQNGNRTTDLSLDLWITAFHLENPQPLPVIIGVAFGTGLLIAGAWGVFQRMSAQRQIRHLERQVARQNLSAKDDHWT